MHSRREKSALKYQFLCQCTSAEGTYRYWWKSKKYYHSYKRNVWSTRIREDTLYLISFKYYLGKYLEQRKEKITFAWSVTAKFISNKCKISVLFCISKTFIQWNMVKKNVCWRITVDATIHPFHKETIHQDDCQILNWIKVSGICTWVFFKLR